MFKLVETSSTSNRYLVRIEGKNYEVEVSKSGELLSLNRKPKSKEIANYSNSRIEFG